MDKLNSFRKDLNRLLLASYLYVVSVLSSLKLKIKYKQKLMKQIETRVEVSENFSANQL